MKEITGILEKKGCDVARLREALVKAAAAEFTTYYYYTVLRANASGLRGEAIKEIVEDARVEDRNHFEALVPRIYELGGELPRDIRQFVEAAACPDAYLPEEPSVEKLLEVLLEAERCAVEVYSEIAGMTAGKDPRTHDLAVAILNEETEHLAWFAELLRGEPSGHYKRSRPGESPHVRRFLQG